MTIFQAKKNVAQKIKGRSASPELDADVLLQALLQKDKTFVLLNRDFELTAEQESRLAEWTDARAQGLPVAYIIGQKEFYGLNFFVDKSVLIPKADTEILVARAVEILSERISARGGSKAKNAGGPISVCKPKNAGGPFAGNGSTPETDGGDAEIASTPETTGGGGDCAQAQDCGRGVLVVCDMCTGSGCVALSVFRTLIDDERIPLEEMPIFYLADISAAALSVAQKNARALLSAAELERVRFVQSNLFDALPGKFDAILSNPPYVPHKEARALLQDGRSEPLLALDGDIGAQGDFSGTDDGLEVFRRLALEARGRLCPGGDFLCETGEYNADSAAAFLRANGYKDVDIELDLEGQKRVVCARL